MYEVHNVTLNTAKLLKPKVKSGNMRIKLIREGQQEEAWVTVVLEDDEIQPNADDSDYIDFAEDGLGNRFCVSVSTLFCHFWDHETGDFSPINCSIQEFVNNIYDAGPIIARDWIDDLLSSCDDVAKFEKAIQSHGYSVQELEQALDGLTLIKRATKYGATQIVAWLLDQGNPIDGLLPIAVNNDHLDLTKLLIQRDADLYEEFSGRDMLAGPRIGGLDAVVNEVENARRIQQ